MGGRLQAEQTADFLRITWPTSPECASLARMVASGIEVLHQDPDGFFMVIEGGRIDHAAHANDPVSVIYDTLALDEAVEEAHDFYMEHKNETLILVLSDHETGGLGLGSDTHGYKLNLSALFNTKVSVDDTLNGSNKYKGDRQNYLLFLAKEFGLGDLTQKEMDTLLKSMSEADTGRKIGYGGYMNPVSLTAARILSERVNINWATTIHTGTVIPLTAAGISAQKFSGWFDNSDIAPTIAGSIVLAQ